MNILTLNKIAACGLNKLGDNYAIGDNIANPDGVIVCETELNGEMVSSPDFECIKQAKYGKTLISIFKNA